MLKSELLKDLNLCFTERSDYYCDERKDFYRQLMRTNDFVRPKQVHGCNIVIDPSTNIEADAIILTQKGKGLVMNFADCTPIVLFDPVLNIAAGIHAGWRGTAQLIAQKTALKMIELGSKPENILAAIGPCISKCCFEVGDEVIEVLKPYCVNKGYYVDLKETNHRQLEAVGLKNFDISPYCTVCNNDRFFSYRKEKIDLRHNIILAL